MSSAAKQTTHEECLGRLSRIEGQVRGIRRMIEEREYCIDIITQIQAAQSAMGAVSRKIIEKHLDTCVSEALAGNSKTDIEDKMHELMRVIKRMCK